ncbi:helix-turn-helix domain-containing protein [uncultured Cellulomonas sp.]|uniref:helix-turn-helix domain-containing protein n=1 Tax=uncultured Cellulomonas sp. TaxID=189682 RepID=UPI0028E1E9D6|nr:helix-turn-helix domain-containing protein [uncultured Cellulomonas sp.]
MVVLLDTRTVAPTDRLPAISAVLEGTTAPCEVRYDDNPERVFTRIEAWRLGSLDVWRNEASGMRMTRETRHLRADPDGRVAIAVQEAGQSLINYDDADPDVRAGIGGLICVDLTKPYDYAWRGMGSAFCISVTADQVGLPAHVVRTASRQLRTSPLYGLFQRHLLGLAHNTDAVAADPAATGVASASVDLLRALLASAAHDVTFERSTIAATLLVQVRAYVQQHLREADLTPGTIARAHNISQRHLFRVCAAADFSLEQWIIGRRLVGAHDDLAQASNLMVPVSSIARRWGFRDPAHFTRRFKATYGLTPREWRRIALSESADA